MTLYSSFDYSFLPMLPPLLYTSLKLSPLRPYTNAVLARLIHPDINNGYPAPRWYVVPPARQGEKDPTEKQSTAERENAIDSDPRIVLGETEFKTIRDKYKVPKHVLPSL